MLPVEYTQALFSEHTLAHTVALGVHGNNNNIRRHWSDERVMPKKEMNGDSMHA